MGKYNFCIVETSAGFIPLAINDNQLLWLHLPYTEFDEAMAPIVTVYGDVALSNNCEFADLGNLLVSYFEGKYVDFFEVPVYMEYLTEFGQLVMTELRRVPYGCVVSYGEIAQRVGRQGAARAVGTTLSHNRTAIILPCHRVISSNHTIGGFSGGLHWKYRLLGIEGIRI